MTCSHTFKTLFKTLSVAAFALTTTAFAQSTNPEWLDALKVQLAEDKQCDVAYYILVNEEEQAGRQFFEARAQCVDGRQFDATKLQPAKHFIITECQTTVCRNDTAPQSKKTAG